MADVASYPGEGILVTIILPTFNRAGRIGAAIRSVIAQTHPTWELLVVDDASTDGTPAVVASFADPRIFLVTLPYNCGSPAQPRNIGLQMARGDYVAYIDDDNTWRPEHLQRLLAAILSHPGAVAAYGGKVHHLPDGRVEEISAPDQGIDTQDGLHTRAALAAIPEGWVGADYCHEDAEFWGKLRARWPGQVVHVPEVLSDYNIHAEQRYNTGYQNTRMYDCAYYARNPSHLADARVRKRFMCIIRALAPENVLDVGCGQGWLFADMDRAGVRAWGVDPTTDLATVCRVPGPTVRARADALPCASWSVDLLVCLDVLSHIPEPRLERSLREFARVARRFLFALDLANVGREGQRTLHPVDWWLVRCATAGIGLTAVQPIAGLTVLVSR